MEIKWEQEANVVSSEDGYYLFCNNCDKEVFKTDNYCHTCGSALVWEQQDKEPCEYCNGKESLMQGDDTTILFYKESFICHTWGGSYNLDWLYCPRCGRSLTEVEHD